MSERGKDPRGRSYPRTIDSGGGETLTFLGRRMTADGEILDVENRVRPGSGPPMHVHFFQEEALTVTAGRIGYQVLGEEPRFAGVGETVAFAPGVFHRFWNAGSEELRCEGFVKPPDNIEYFLESLYDSQRAAGGHRPDPFDAAFLVWRYRSEFAMKEIPRFVQRYVIPLQVLVGRLLGKYGKFADAPAPVTVSERGGRRGGGTTPEAAQ